jgi:hypothetical protein
MQYVWIALMVIAGSAVIWFAVIFGWVFLAWRAMRLGAIRTWDELSPEHAEFQPLARPRRFPFRSRY